LFNAGSAVGYFKLDNSGFIQGVNQAKTANESMTGSMVKAGIILEALKKGFEIVTGFVRDSTKAYIESEKAGAQLNAVLKSTGGVAGITANEVKALGEKYQNLTTFEDDAIISAQNLLLTFTKISKDIFPQTTETVLNMSQALGQDLKSSAIQLGKALQDPITGITALRRVGVNFNDAQKDMIEGLVKSGRLLDAQKVILKELNTEFGGSAMAARQTFGGSLLYLQNMFSDLQETFGKFVAGFGKGFVDEMANGTKAITEFLNKASTIETIINIASMAGGAINVIKTAFGEMSKIIGPVADMIVNKLVAGFSELKGGLTNTQIVIGTFTGALTIFTGFIKIAGTAIGAIINNFFNFANYIKDFVGIYVKVGQTIWNVMKSVYDVIVQTITTAKLLFEALKDPLNMEKWKIAGGGITGILTKMTDGFNQVVKDAGATGDQIQKTIDSGKKWIIEGGQGMVDVFKQMVTQIAGFGKDSQAMYDKLMESYEAGAIKTQDDLNAFFKANPVTGPAVINGETNEPQPTEEQLKEKQKINDKYNDEEKKKQDEHLKAMFDTANTYANAAISSAQMMVDGIGSILNTSYQNELDAITLKYEAQTAVIDENQTALLEKNNIAYEQEISDLDNKLLTGQITQAQYDLAAKDIKTKKEAEDKKINEKAAADKNALEKKQLEEENAVKKKQFETNKALAIVNIWLNLASAIMGYVASFAPMGIPGVVLMAVMSALATGIAIAQTVVVSQQQFVPARAEGGDVQANKPVLVGERGREIFVPGMSGSIIDAAMSREVLKESTSNSKNYAVDIHDNNISDQMDLNKITQHVIDELGRQVG
jgi:hypothetical protein